MKRKIALLIIAVMMISLSSCKRKPQGDVSVAPGAAPETSENAETKEAENNADTEKENTVKDDDTEEPDTKQESPDNSALINKEDDLLSKQESVKTNNDTIKNTEISHEDQNLNEMPQDSQIELEQYMPYVWGYVDANEENGQIKYSAKKNKFTIEFPITKGIRDKAWADMAEDRQRDYFADFTMIPNVMYDKNFQNLDEIEESMAKDEYVIVRGSFQPEYGTSVSNYEKIGFGTYPDFDYHCYNSFTRYNFKVDKLYTSGGDFAVGDIIPVAFGGTIVQLTDKTYFAAIGQHRYMDFSQKNLEERTFILALRLSDFENYNGYYIGPIFQKAYEDVQDNTGDKYKQIAYDILQKYN